MVYRSACSKGCLTLQITGPIENILRHNSNNHPKTRFSSEEWVIDGLNNGTMTGAILIRKKDREQEEIGGKPLFRLTRHLHLDMDWKTENLQRQGSNQQPLLNLCIGRREAITGGFTQEGNQLLSMSMQNSSRSSGHPGLNGRRPCNLGPQIPSFQ